MPSSGGGGGGKIKLPGYIQDASQQILNAQAGQFNTPYEAYGGQRVSDFTPDRLQAWNQIRQMQGGAEGAYGASQDALYNAMQASGPVTADQVAAATNQFMNPYNRNVLDVAQNEFNRQANIQQGNIGGQAANIGAYGGDRQAVLEGTMRAEAARNMGQLAAQTQQQGYSQAMQNAMGMLQQNQQYGMQAAGLLPQVASQQQAQRLHDAQSLAAVGQAQQQHQQQQLDVNYQDFLRKQGYRQDQIDAYARTLSMQPGASLAQAGGGGGGGLMGGLKGAAGGAMSGAALGSMAGPWGTVIGGVGGGVAGGLMGGL